MLFHFKQESKYPKPAFGQVLLFICALALAAGIFVPAHGAKASIALVSSANNGGSGPSFAVTLNVKTGNLLVVVCRQGDPVNAGAGFDLQTVSDTAGNTFYPVISTAIPRNGTDLIKLWYAKNVAGNASDVITCTFGEADTSQSIIALQYSGADPVAPLDAKSTGVVESAADTYLKSATTAPFSTGASNEVIVVCGSQDNTTQVYTAGPGYTLESSENVSYTACEDKLVSSMQSNVTASMNSDTARGWELVLGSFKAAGGVQANLRSDTLSDPRPSATSNHAFSFTVNSSIYGSSSTNSSTLSLALDPAFAIPDTLDCGDIDAATGSQFNFNYPSCQATATAWGFSVRQAGINLVQQFAGSNNGSTSSSQPFSNSNTAGNLIVAVVEWADVTINVSSLTDSAGNTYTSAIGPINWNASSPQNRAQIFYAKNIKGGANTVTARLSGAANPLELYILEYSGVDPVSPLDAVSSATGSSPGVMDSGTATTTYPSELIFGAGFSGAVTSSPGFTIRSSFDSNLIEDKYVNSAGPYKVTMQGNSAWVALMVTFRAAGGNSLVLTAPTDTAVHVASGTPVTIKVGSNAVVGQQGAHWMTNPATAGVYRVAIAGTFGGSGSMLVSIRAGVTVSATVAESLAFTVAPPGFPSTGILDNFNRADENPLANGNWSGPAESGHGQLRVFSNAANNTGGGSDSYWNSSSFGPDSEAYVTITTLPLGSDCVAVLARGSGFNSGSFQAYWAEYCNVSGASNDTFTLYRFVSGASTPIANGIQEVSVGDSIGMDVIGARVRMLYKAAAGSWTQILNVTDANITGSGKVGLHMEDTTTAADNFGGGAAYGCPADDGATVQAISTSATSVPFGNISPNTFYQGCQDLTVSTNAGNGYSVTVQESSAFKTADGRFTFPDTTCDAGDCTVVAATTWVTPTKNGFGHTCFNQTGSDCNPAYGNGTKFKPVPNVAAGTGPGTPQFVQGNNQGGAGTIFSAGFPSNNTAGNLIVVSAGWDNTSITAAIHDTAGNLYATAVGPIAHPTANIKNQIWYAKNIKGGANTVTVDYSGSIFGETMIHEYGGIDTASPLDVTASSTGNSLSPTSGPATTNFANELIFGSAVNAIATLSAGATFNQREAIFGDVSEDKSGFAAGSYTATSTVDSANAWIQTMATFKAASVNPMTTLMFNTGSVTNSTGRVKYRLSVPTSQAAGTYTTVITYTILGTF